MMIIKAFPLVIFLTCLSFFIEARTIIPNCRKFVHHPACRGISAKRDVRLLVDENGQLLQPKDLETERPLDKNALNNDYFLWNEFLRRNFEKMDLDTGTNYLK